MLYESDCYENFYENSLSGKESLRKSNSLFLLLGKSYGILAIKKLATLERCAARGEEVAALQLARARRLRQDAIFFLE